MTLIADFAPLFDGENLPESWFRAEARAQETFPIGDVPFLTDEYLDEISTNLQLSENNRRTIAKAMRRVRGDEQLRGLFWLWHHILFCDSAPSGEDIAHWPVPYRSAAFPAVVLLSGFPTLKKMYEERNVPDDVAQDTLFAVNECMDLYKETTGENGLGTMYMNWLLHHFRGQLYKLGRLEFEMRPLGNDVRVFRHRKNGRLTTFLAEHIEEKSGRMTGTSVSKNGCVGERPISIDLSMWELKLQPGDSVLSVHIPRRGKLHPKLCDDAFERARSFFATCFPEERFRAFYCGSWMMDPKLRMLLDDQSNLIQFQRRFQLFPLAGSDDSVYRFVFQCSKREAALLPERTSLQKKLKKFMASGGRIDSKGGYILI